MFQREIITLFHGILNCFLSKSSKSSVPGLGVEHLGVYIIPAKREAVNAILIHRAELIELISLHPIDQQGSPCCHNFLTLTPSYHSKVTSIGASTAKHIAKALFQYL